MGPYDYRPWQAPPPPPPRTDGRAVAALCLGLLAMAGLGGAAGVPAIILGAMSRRDIDRANGTLTGRAVAAGGIVTGLFGTGIGFVMLLWAAGNLFTPVTDTTAAVPIVVGPDEATPDLSPPPLPAGTRAYGTLTVIDLDSSRPLRGQLAEIISHARGKTVVLQTYVNGSRECDDVAAAFVDQRMQSALDNVTLVRVEVDEYRRELARMKVETNSAPWFYKLDAKAQPVDSISADAWAENIPENMAPVLSRFVRKTR